MASFVQRTEAPDTSNAYYYANNPFHASGYGLPNCTCYAWGRFWECQGSGGSRPKLSLDNAENWYGHADGYARGKTPKVGAVICWRKGQAGNSSDGAGHVEIVEAVNDDGTIVTTGSAWNGYLFRTKKRNPTANWDGGDYIFQGFIYNPADFDGTGGTELTYVTGNRYLTQAEMETNARYIWNYLGSRGWSMNAVAGMLGNMQTESTINPGIWQGLNEGIGPAFGLVQWDPFTKYTNWCEEKGLDPEHMESALMRIIYELANGLQFYPTNTYKMTFEEFKVSTADPYTLGMVFLYNYERPAVTNQPKRGTQAEAWYEFLSGLPAPVDPSRTKRKGLPLLLMYIASKRKV